MWRHVLLMPILCGFFLHYHRVDSCNEAVCGSVVSKCLLTQSCKCDLANCTCCKECFNCLSYLYSECCSCVDMCPRQNDTENRLSANSNVEEFLESIPGLFSVLTEFPDPHNRWNSTTYPVDYNSTHISVSKELKLALQTIEQEVVPKKPTIITVNCTVAFLSQCTSWMKCRTSCQSMGASSYRWFHDGCCECVGERCINYGINESRCRECSWDKNNEITEEEQEENDEYVSEESDDENDSGTNR